jgi:hypothetical protein
MERYAEIIAALKVRTSNKQGRKISTKRAIELLEDHGVETPDGLVKAPKGLLARATIDRFMRQAGYDHRRIIAARGGPISCPSIERALAVRHVAFGLEACEDAALVRRKPGQADLDAVQRGR